MPGEPTPCRAYLVSWSVANDLQAMVYADSAADARERFHAGEIEWQENTGHDWRVRRPRITRLPDEDRDA